jgi:hypothetical protein
MSADLSDEQAKNMSEKITDIEEQWKILIEGLDTLKERLEKIIKSWFCNLFFKAFITNI